MQTWKYGLESSIDGLDEVGNAYEGAFPGLIANTAFKSFSMCMPGTDDDRLTFIEVRSCHFDFSDGIYPFLGFSSSQCAALSNSVGKCTVSRHV